MARRLSNDDFEATFDAFLKTSVSSEDDTEKINDLLRHPKKAKPKDQGLWWMREEDKKKEASPAKSFLKSKKPASSESPVKVKATDHGTSSRSPRGKITKHAVSKKAKGKGSRESSPGNIKSRGRGPSDVSMSKDSLEDISEKSEEHDLHGHNGFSRHPPESSYETTQESVTTDYNIGLTEGAGSLMGSDSSPGKLGIDTLDELAEKQKFFQDLENKAHGELDYSQLNRELSATGTMHSPGIGMGNIVGISDDSGDSAPHRPDPDHHHAEVDVSFDKETSSHQKPSMLSKVSLLDSMDSTLNTTTSPQAPHDSATSRDTTGGHTMPEMPKAQGTGAYLSTSGRNTTQDNLGQTDSMKTQGTAGAVGTATSREIEELHEALREVGAWPSRGDSRNATGSAPLSRKPTDRSVGQLLEEMDKITERQKARIADDMDVKLMSDYKSPRSPRSPGLHRQGNMEDDRGFDHSHTDDTEVYNPVTAVGKRGQKNSVSEKSSAKSAKKKPEKTSSTPNSKTVEERGRRSSRDRYGHVQSSGYGKRSPEVTPCKSQTPSVSPIRPAGRGQMVRASLDSARTRKSSLSPSPRRQHSETKRPSQTQPVRSRSAFQPASSEDEPNMSSYMHNGATTRVRDDILMEELKDLRNQLQEERQKTTRLMSERAAQERETTRQLESQRLDYEEEISKLKQDNFVLTAKLKDLESQSSVKGSGEGVGVSYTSSDPPTREQMVHLEKEVKQQEELLARFQAENKRLYEDIRSKEKSAKATEEAMFKENQRLSAELTAVRSQLEQKETELRSKGIITSLAAQQHIAAGNPESVTEATRTAHLEADIRECKRQHDNTLREMKALQQSRSELEKHVDALVMEREMIKKQLAAARQARPEEIKELEKKHGEEVERLTRKLKWYAENQELLDKSTCTIKAKSEEINKLKQRIEELQTETGKRLEENKIVAKQKAADTKKIQDLERQVKEMEQIVRRRHPNSLPALMLAAATAPDPSQPGSTVQSRTVDVLEKRIKKLEGELEKKDEESGVLLRGMEQKYNTVKFQFEERVADLESQLRLYKRFGEDGKPYEHPHTHTVALERELDSTRERHKKQVTELTNQVEKLTSQLSKLRKQQDNSHRSEAERWLQVETDLRAQVASLQAALQEKDKDLNTVMATVDRLQKAASKGKHADENYAQTDLNTFPESGKAALQAKTYKPEMFADLPAHALIRENERLKEKLELLQLEKDQQRVDLRRSLAETEAMARRSIEEYEKQIESLHAAHEKEVTRMKAEQAVYNATSKVASLQSRCDSQAVMVQHLQRQLAQRDAELEQMSGLRKSEAELKEQVEQLQDKLREAKRNQTPEMRHFEALEEKIAALTDRHTKREQELEALRRSSQRCASQELVEEAAKWKRMVETKNLEICKFREELDTILNVLRELQRQGIKIPYSAPPALYS